MNSPSPKLSNLIAQKIKHLINQGEFSEKLPSERALSIRFSVGRGTLRTALSILEDEKIISPAKTKSVRKILKSKLPVEKTALPESTPRILSFVSSVPLRSIPQSVFVEIYQLRTLLLEDNIVIKIFEITKNSKAAIEAELSLLSKTVPAICWILYQAPESVQIWFQKNNLPCIVRGSTYPSANLPFLDCDWAALVQHAATRLWQKGHQNIMLCVPDKRLRGNALMEERFTHLSLKNFNPIVAKIPTRPEEFMEQMDEIFKKGHPSAAIIIDGYTIVPLLAWCQTRGLTIPNDLSVISVSTQRFMQNLTPKFSVYEDVHGKAAKKLYSMIRTLNCGGNIRGRYLLPEYYPGETVIEIPRSSPQGSQKGSNS